MSFRIDNFEDSLINNLVNYKVPYPIFTAGTAGTQSGSQFTDYASVPLYYDSQETMGKNYGTANFIDTVTGLNGNSVFGPVNSSIMYEIGTFSIPVQNDKNVYLYTFQYASTTFQLSSSVFSSTGEYTYQIMAASKNKINLPTSTTPVSIDSPNYYVPSSSEGVFIGSIKVTVNENGNRYVTIILQNGQPKDFFPGNIPTVYYKFDDFSFNGYQGLTNDYYYPGK